MTVGPRWYDTHPQVVAKGGDHFDVKHPSGDERLTWAVQPRPGNRFVAFERYRDEPERFLYPDVDGAIARALREVGGQR